MNTKHRSCLISSAAAPKRSHLLLVVAFFVLCGCVSVNWVSGAWWLWGLAGCGALISFLLRGSGKRSTAGDILESEAARVDLEDFLSMVTL